MLGLLIWSLTLFSCAAPSANQNAESGKDGFKVAYNQQKFSQADVFGILAANKGTGIFLAEFDQCTFTSNIRFGPLAHVFQSFAASCIFRNCTFEGDLEADMTFFQGQISFGKCRFKKNVNFQNAVFAGPAGFRECTFDGDAMFQNTVFWKENNWMGSHFYGVGLFQAARFMEKAQFGNVVFHANADFSLTRLEEGIAMEYARSEGRVDFTDARSMGLMSFRSSVLKQVNMSQIRSYGPVRFGQAEVADSIVKKGARFLGDLPEWPAKN